MKHRPRNCRSNFSETPLCEANRRFAAARVVVPLEECVLCGGTGKRMVRKPPYWDINDLEEVVCCDCYGTGRREREQRHNAEVSDGGPLTQPETQARTRRSLD